MKQYELGLYEKAMPARLPWIEKLVAAREAGFDYLEISIDETEEKLHRLDMTRGQRLDLCTAMMEAELPIRTMCLSGHRKYPLGSPTTCMRGLEIMERGVELAADLGVRIIQLAGYDVYYEESTPDTVVRFGENLQKAVQMAARAGVVLGFETMETLFMDTVTKAMAYVSQINSPYLQIYPDVGNLTNAAAIYGTDLLGDFRTGDGHLVAVHLKETVPGHYRQIPYGTGHVDFSAVVDCAWSMGVRKFTAEFWYTGDPRWREELGRAYSLLGGVLDCAGG